MPDPIRKFIESKLPDWLYRIAVILLLGALAFLSDSAKKADLVPLRADLAELKRAVTELDKKMAVNDALRARELSRRSGDQE
jgi:hypothetical protein